MYSLLSLSVVKLYSCSPLFNVFYNNNQIALEKGYMVKF